MEDLIPLLCFVEVMTFTFCVGIVVHCSLTTKRVKRIKGRVMVLASPFTFDSPLGCKTEPLGWALHVYYGSVIHILLEVSII